MPGLSNNVRVGKERPKTVACQLKLQIEVSKKQWVATFVFYMKFYMKRMPLDIQITQMSLKWELEAVSKGESMCMFKCPYQANKCI